MPWEIPYAIIRSVFLLRFSRELNLRCYKSILWDRQSGTVGHLKPCQIKIEGAWESRRGSKQGNLYLVQESLENVKRGRIDHVHREFIPRDGKSHSEGCVPPE